MWRIDKELFRGMWGREIRIDQIHTEINDLVTFSAHLHNHDNSDLLP